MNAAYRLRIGCNASNAPDHERSLLHGLSDSLVSGFEPTPAYTVGHERFHIRLAKGWFSMAQSVIPLKSSSVMGMQRRVQDWRTCALKSSFPIRSTRSRAAPLISTSRSIYVTSRCWGERTSQNQAGGCETRRPGLAGQLEVRDAPQGQGVQG
jgi:hypothetical protein